jgi:hypothetical protein
MKIPLNNEHAMFAALMKIPLNNEHAMFAALMKIPLNNEHSMFAALMKIPLNNEHAMFAALDFTSAIFNNVLNFSGVKNIDIDLKHAIIDRIEYGNVEFKSDNRETFLTLKNAALKQHDQIKALEFHTQEYQTHLKALRKNKTTKNLSDRLVLTFEYLVSNFGTNVWRSLVSLLVLTAVFYLVINRCNLDTESLVKFILFLRVKF